MSLLKLNTEAYSTKEFIDIRRMALPVENCLNKNGDLMNSFPDVMAVFPWSHRIGVAVDLARSVVVAMSVASHVTKNVRMLHRHVCQGDPQRVHSVDGQRRFVLCAQPS